MKLAKSMSKSNLLDTKPVGAAFCRQHNRIKITNEISNKKRIIKTTPKG
ncbi:MAG: hypothetical protein FWE22_03880 [Firmicutes bacterium]|nr:hypothetical protein [Bacillota bacterium]